MWHFGKRYFLFGIRLKYFHFTLFSKQISLSNLLSSSQKLYLRPLTSHTFATTILHFLSFKPYKYVILKPLFVFLFLLIFNNGSLTTTIRRSITTNNNYSTICSSLFVSITTTSTRSKYAFYYSCSQVECFRLNSCRF